MRDADVPITGESLRAVLARNGALGPVARDISPDAFERVARTLNAARRCQRIAKDQEISCKQMQRRVNELRSALQHYQEPRPEGWEWLPDHPLKAELEREVRACENDLRWTQVLLPRVAGQTAHRDEWRKIAGGLSDVFDRMTAPKTLGHTSGTRLKFVAAAVALVTGEAPSVGNIKLHLLNERRVKR